MERVLVTGATGFVGRGLVRALLARGIQPVCLVRSPKKLFAQHPELEPPRLTAVEGNLEDVSALEQATQGSQAVLHLVGIILERRLKGQTFHRVHVRGTQNVLRAAERAGIKRFLHMSALGTRPDAVSRYHKTKWLAEELVRRSGLDWTIFRPSLIHGPQGEFMRLMKILVTSRFPPFIPCFGSGLSRIQPVWVKDVAHSLVEALFRPETTGKTYPLGGARAYTWRELYELCRRLIPGAKSWKPLVSQPVPLAKLVAKLSGPVLALAEVVVPSVGLFRFDSGQVQMSQEDSVCDPAPAEQALGVRFRRFDEELALYADRIA